MVGQDRSATRVLAGIPSKARHVNRLWILGASKPAMVVVRVRLMEILLWKPSFSVPSPKTKKYPEYHPFNPTKGSAKKLRKESGEKVRM